MNIMKSLLQELEQEASATERLLDLVPEEKLGWRPHSHSMTLGQLAQHVATIPGSVSALLSLDGFDARNTDFTPKQPESKEQIRSAFSKALKEAKDILGSWDEAKATSNWRLTSGETEVFNLPRIGLARTILFNHWYHHRGQLTVYLRLLDLPLPVTYGRSADVNPFA